MEALEEAKDVKILSLKPTDVIVFRLAAMSITEHMRNNIAKHMEQCGIKNKTLMIGKEIEIFVISQGEAVLESL